MEQKSPYWNPLFFVFAYLLFIDLLCTRIKFCNQYQLNKIRMEIGVSFWIGFFVFVIVMLCLDLFVFNKKIRKIKALNKV